MGDFARAATLQGFSKLVSELGGDTATLLVKAGLKPQDLDDLDALIPVSKAFGALEIAATLLKRPDFGLLLGSQQDFRIYGPLSTLLFSAPTLRHGLEAVAEFSNYFNQSTNFIFSTAVRSGFGFYGSAYFGQQGSKYMQAAERACASCHHAFNLSQSLVAGTAEIWFAHQPLSTLSTYQRILGATPHFGMSATGILVSKKVLEEPRPSRSDHLFSMAKEFLQGTKHSPETSLNIKVDFYIRTNLMNGDFSQAAIASMIGVGERTLQRNLAKSGTSYAKILDQVRRSVAQIYLADPQIPLIEISHRLGYAEMSSFSRACRRWFGESCRAIRANYRNTQNNPTN